MIDPAVQGADSQFADAVIMPTDGWWAPGAHPVGLRGIYALPWSGFGPTRRPKGSAAVEPTEVVMAVVHVKAPPEVDPHLIGAELTRALCRSGRRAMTAELALAGELRRRPPGRPRRHGFVALLSLPGEAGAEDLARRVRKLARKALRRRFGDEVSTEVKIDIPATEAAAYWCTVRGMPYHTVSWY
jgi:hypothetical protein